MTKNHIKIALTRAWLKCLLSSKSNSDTKRSYLACQLARHMKKKEVLPIEVNLNCNLISILSACFQDNVFSFCNRLCIDRQDGIFFPITVSWWQRRMSITFYWQTWGVSVGLSLTCDYIYFTTALDYPLMWQKCIAQRKYKNICLQKNAT